MHWDLRWVMMINRVRSSALSDLRPAVRLAGPAQPFIGLHECGAAGAAARGRRAAPHQSAAPRGLGRPRCAPRADPPPPAVAAESPAGYPRYPPPGAPPPPPPPKLLPHPHPPATPHTL